MRFDFPPLEADVFSTVNQLSANDAIKQEVKKAHTCTPFETREVRRGRPALRPPEVFAVVVEVPAHERLGGVLENQYHAVAVHVLHLFQKKRTRAAWNGRGDERGMRVRLRLVRTTAAAGERWAGPCEVYEGRHQPAKL